MLLTWVTLGLVVATVALVIVTRQGTEQARAAARDELNLLRQQFGAEHRPLLVDVLTTADVPPDVGASEDVHRMVGPNETVVYSEPTIETMFDGLPVESFDPRTVFVRLSGDMIYISAPLRNVGRGSP
jgi:hypothetical protein